LHTGRTEFLPGPGQIRIRPHLSSVKNATRNILAMKFEWFVAGRYFRGKRKGSSFLSFIKIMAVGGVAIGAAGLLIALSVVHGFKSVIEDKILGYGAHITIETFTDRGIQRADTLAAFIAGLPGVDAAQPVVFGQGMIQVRQQVDGGFIKGVDPSGDLTNIHEYINRGVYDLRTGYHPVGEADSLELPGAVIGNGLARNLLAEPGSVLTLYTIRGVPGADNFPEIMQFRVSGIYQTGIQEFDDAFVLIGIEHARRLFNLTGQTASLIDVRVSETGLINTVQRAIDNHITFPLYTESIYQRYSSIFAWINLQEQTIPFVILVLVVVAAFNLIGTVLMMVLERTRDIGILKAMGTRDKAVQSIFLYEGIIVGATGLVIGIALSLLFWYLQATWEFIPLSEENYYMSTAPVEPHLLDFFIVSGVTMLLCAMASWLPARVASRLNPLQVIHYGK
jgi:lipoprotein-releasing system permease protein